MHCRSSYAGPQQVQCIGSNLGVSAQVSKTLACGDVGVGAMAAPVAIDEAVRAAVPGSTCENSVSGQETA